MTTKKKKSSPAKQPGSKEASDQMRANLAKLPANLRITFLHGFWEAMRYSCFCEQEKHGLLANKHYMALQLEIEKELEEASRRNAVRR